MLHRLLPLLLIIVAFSYIVLNFQTLKRDIFYKLNLADDHTSSCCNEAEIAKSTGDFDENDIVRYKDKYGRV